MSWAVLSGLLSQTSIWSAATLQLALEGRKVEPAEYCRPGPNRDRQTVMVPDMDKVKGWLRRGASMVLNDIDQLTPGLKAAAAALERGLEGKVQANLYCSWRAHPGFGSHFDTHEVFALHIAGEKTWRIYERHFEDPVNHPSFKSFGQDFHDRQRGALSMEVPMRPGDLLYIPRGWYHDALATSAASLHVAFGLTSAIGLDLVGVLFDRAVQDPLFRAAVPSGAALGPHVGRLADRLAALGREAGTLAAFAAFVDAFRYPREGISLPADAAAGAGWRVGPADARVLERQGRWFVGAGGRAVAVPPGLEEPIGWILAAGEVDDDGLAAAFPALGQERRARLFADLVTHGHPNRSISKH